MQRFSKDVIQYEGIKILYGYYSESYNYRMAIQVYNIAIIKIKMMEA